MKKYMLDENRRNRIVAVGLLAVLTLMFVPWLGLTPFNTKGEPREAIVALSMLQSGNWILPVSFGVDIPYKPPFLAWCIALFSLPQGEVSEFTSRLPSALAAISLGMMTFCFVRRRMGGAMTGALSALVLVSSVEVWRAASACRVDMLLTAFIFGSMLVLWRWREEGYRSVPWVATLLMTCGVLTKGPVAMLLPCLAVGIFGLLRGERFMGLFLRLAAVGVCSLIVPALWYVTAYRMGGDEFLRLAMEENFGRMTGTMSYSSHEKGLWYNFVTPLLGMAPYTLLWLFGAAVVKYRMPTSVKETFRRLWNRMRRADSAKAFIIVSAVVVFVFYCFPRSKRSVYLLPIYPALAIATVEMLRMLIARRGNLVRVYSAIIGFVAVVAGGAALTLPLLPDGLLPKLLSSIKVSGLGRTIGVLALLGGIYLNWTLWMRRTVWCERTAIVVTLLVECSLSAAFLPGIMDNKSDLGFARQIEAAVPEGVVYTYVDEPLLRYYTVNFYLSDRLRRYEDELPTEGYMIVSEPDLTAWERNYGGIYEVEDVIVPDHRSCDRRQPVKLVRIYVKK